MAGPALHNEKQNCLTFYIGFLLFFLWKKVVCNILVKQMNLVDTPGTNVILQRQQRLTEEFVPRADLLFFVISADRPLTESEVYELNLSLINIECLYP